MLTPEQQATFEKLAKDYADRYEQLTQQREQTFQKAVKDTKDLLDAEQQKKYDELRKTRLWRPSTTLPGGV
jgi:hypothetical protein